MAGHILHQSILREYDIRGIVGETLSADDAYAIGRSFGSIVSQNSGRTVAVGYDGRHSSPGFEKMVVDGLTDCGLEVIRIGLGGTPMLYFAVHDLAADAGIMVSGSHNPPNFNGFKMVLSDRPFFGQDILRLGAVAAKKEWVSGSGYSHNYEIIQKYVARILRDYTSPRGLKVAWDSGNGAAGPAMEKLIESLPGNHYPLNSEVNGDFPNHHPDPTVPECLKQLQMEVAERRCDLGIAFDGDGDRIGVVDDQGEILWGDQLMVLFAADVLSFKPNSTIIADVKASQVLFDEILKMGGTPEMWRTGHSLIKSRMIETGAPLAGEMSGHIFFADKWFGFDDGLYAAVRLLSFLGKQNKPLSEFRAELPKVYNTPEIRIACEDLRKFDVVSRVLSSLRDSNAKIIDVDGIRVQTDDGWWLLRASNTEPVLVARCESYTASGLQRLQDTLRDQLSENGVKISEL